MEAITTLKFLSRNLARYSSNTSFYSEPFSLSTVPISLRIPKFVMLDSGLDTLQFCIIPNSSAVLALNQSPRQGVHHRRRSSDFDISLLDGDEEDDDEHELSNNRQHEHARSLLEQYFDLVGTIRSGECHLCATVYLYVTPSQSACNI
jgi:hypothetical protein